MEQTSIAALSTPPGRGGLAVIRISGPQAENILRSLFIPVKRDATGFDERKMMFGKLIHQGKLLDECMAVLFRAPRSYTREDVAEIHVHASEQVINSVLHAVFSLGAIPAAPGEFTRRAFENGRLDLSQAEAVMQLIAASGQQAADAALRQLQGGALRFVQAAQAQLISLMAGVTAAIDYPEEIDEAEAVGNIAPQLRALAGELERQGNLQTARILEEGLQVVICGKPNVGKSSLLNALLHEERAIVTDIPGTTRDAVTGSTQIGGIRVNLKDTAGIRQSGETVEQLGIKRALDAVKSADLRLFVLDRSCLPDAEDEQVLHAITGLPSVLVINKSDLPDHPGFAHWIDSHRDKLPENTIHLSASTGEGLDSLRQAIHAQAGQPEHSALTLARHIRLASQAAGSLRNAAQAMEEGLPLDICAVDLNDALASLGRITGDNYSEELLDEVFSAFCVGK